MTSKFDEYTIYARFFPAVLSAVPLFVLWFFLAKERDWRDLLSFVIGLKFLGTISLSVVFLYGYSQFIKITGKHFERKYFTASRGFPTTYFMLYSDSRFSTEYKDKFRERVKKNLKLDLPGAADEASNPTEARKRLDECFNHIRLRVGSGKLVLKHNIWYGFSRNIVGGSIYSVLFCLVCIVLGLTSFRASSLVASSVALLGVYLAILLFRKPIILQNAEAYARQLISEFMASGSRSASSK